MKIQIINGPNLNLLGVREPDVYGNVSFAAYFTQLQAIFPDVELDYFQSNIEGEIVDKIHEAGFGFDGIVLNAAGYTHTSVAIRDAIKAVPAPVVEVHISNVFAREEFRHRSMLSAVCEGIIVGFGLDSYRLAIEALRGKNKKQEQDKKRKIMHKHTKIIATISDKRCDTSFIQQLFNEGMDVVRMNSAHLNKEGFLKIVHNVREVSNRIALLLDTKGPEIRTTKAEAPIELYAGDLIRIAGNPNGISSREVIYVSYPDIAKEMQPGEDILIDDGEIDLKVEEVHADYILCRVQNDGVVGSRKSVNIPGVRINLPTITDRDRKFIRLAIESDIDFIAHSFVRNKEDVLAVQKILDEYNSPIKIIAKIENQEGVDNADEILDVAYGIMVARGDLGIEVPQEKIPGIQRSLIRKAIRYKNPLLWQRRCCTR